MEMRDPSGNSTIHVGPGEGRAVRMEGALLITCKVGSEQTGGAYSLFEVVVKPGEALSRTSSTGRTSASMCSKAALSFLSKARG